MSNYAYIIFIIKQHTTMTTTTQNIINSIDIKLNGNSVDISILSTADFTVTDVMFNSDLFNMIQSQVDMFLSSNNINKNSVDINLVA